MCPYNLLESLVDMIVHNDDDENVLVAKIIDTVYALKNKLCDASEWMVGIPPDMFSDTMSLTHNGTEVAKFDVSQWTTERKHAFVAQHLLNYSQQQSEANSQFILWREFQKFLISQLMIPKSKFRTTEWKEITKTESEKPDSRTVKWRA